MLRSLALGMLVVALTRTSSAEPLGTTRVAVIDSSRLFVAGGIARWAEARAALDAEHPSYNPVEAPAGTRRIEKIDVPKGMDPKTEAELRKRLGEIDREASRSAMWEAHETEVLAPIEADVRAKLVQFATAHGIGLVIDSYKLDSAAVLVRLPGTDITKAFLDEYNARARAPRK